MTKSRQPAKSNHQMVDHMDDWTFNGASTREYTHCYHDYPARMIPQIARRLLSLYANNKGILFDPYCGTGTSLVEGMIYGLDVVGTDLNPLVRLIAEAKTQSIDASSVEGQIEEFEGETSFALPKPKKVIETLDGIARLEYWFRPQVISDLSFILEKIQAIRNPKVRRFFEVAFSETVREASNTRKDEFKLYRLNEEKLRRHNPDTVGIFVSKLRRNLKGLTALGEKLKTLPHSPHSSVLSFNSVEEIPANAITPKSIDLVITSPPYGDSHTTVAYGQYSRLSSAWLGLEEPSGVDRQLMGGVRAKKIEEFECTELNKSIRRIHRVDPKRALEVASFYSDLRSSIANVGLVVKPGGIACYVVGNRRVKGTVLPTDKSIVSFFEAGGFDHVDTFQRSIPNKRMPHKNSPSNKSGDKATTMLNEYIVVVRKRKNKKSI